MLLNDGARHMSDILVIGRHASMMERALSMLAQAGFSAEGALKDEEAVERFAQHRHKLVVLGGGVEEASRRYFKEALPGLRSDVHFVEHFGGPQGLLENVAQAMKSPSQSS